MTARKWAPVVIRAFGVLNLSFAVVGMWFATTFTRNVIAHGSANPSEEPYFLQAFWTMTAINVGFLAVLALAGVRLLQLRPRGVTVCNVLFLAEVLYFFCIPWGPYLPRNVSMSIAGATGVGNMGIGPQLVTGYPIIALIALNLARRRLVADKT